MKVEGRVKESPKLLEKFEESDAKTEATLEIKKESINEPMKMEDLFDISKVLQVKRLKAAIDSLTPAEVKNYVQMGFVNKTSGSYGINRSKDRQRYRW